MAATADAPLRRWKPFFPAFAIVDAAIEASVPALCRRNKVRSARAEVEELLRAVPAADVRKAEEFCVLLDGFMAESLLTLQAIPGEAVPRLLASSAHLAKAVGVLRRHQSERVRGLARDVIRGWTAAVEEDFARTSAAMKRLDDACHAKPAEASHPKTNKTAPVAAAGHGPRRMENKKAPAANRELCGRPADAEKMEATKRKLQQGYREVEDAKRQHKVQMIPAPKKMEQRQRKTHPLFPERSQARSGRSTVLGHCLVSSY